jgi:hypothetical protein
MNNDDLPVWVDFGGPRGLFHLGGRSTATDNMAGKAGHKLL